MTCAACLNDPNDNCMPHARAPSSKCHAHVPNLSDVINNLLGSSRHMKVRKCTLYSALKMPGGTRTRRRKQKKAIIMEIARVVNWICQVAIKTQCFIQYYILYKLSEQEELSPSVFKPNCIYGFMQLIIGQEMTNNGREMPQDRQLVFCIYQALFNKPSDCTVDNLAWYTDVFLWFVVHQKSLSGIQ